MANAAPLVCICIPCYNSEKTIGETIQSALKQTYSNFIIRVLDNASTDRTLQIVESFKDERITIYRSEKNIGAIANFDRCIELACGKYTEIFHADEVYEPEIVARQVESLESNPEAGVAFTEAFLIDSESKAFGQTSVARYLGREKGQTVLLNYEELFPVILRAGNFLLCSGALVRTEIYQKEIQKWNGQQFLTSCDLDVWLRILEQHKILIILENLMSTRTSQTQASYLELKRNTNRADMFLVLDYYLQKPRSQNAVKKSDILGYQALERMDIARRAMNMYLMGQTKEAGALLKGHFHFELLAKAFESKRGMLTFLLISYLKFVLLLGLDKMGHHILHAIVIKTKR
ncbi:glycosyltransferase family 2 protein [Bdellovibrio sp. HCB337]|uniref:glycosyltransferase family 2 protein n=1 Tax=Bdellovibrio sp. HCB337 TaxID=3394358 RepID=UPI0039A64168